MASLVTAHACTHACAHTHRELSVCMQRVFHDDQSLLMMLPLAFNWVKDVKKKKTTKTAVWTDINSLGFNLLLSSKYVPC